MTLFCSYICMLNYSYWFLCVKWPWILDHVFTYEHFWNGLLNSVCRSFAKNFCVCVHQGNRSVIFFWAVFSSGLGIRIALGLYNELSGVCFPSILRSMAISSSWRFSRTEQSLLGLTLCLLGDCSIWSLRVHLFLSSCVIVIGHMCLVTN